MKQANKFMVVPYEEKKITKIENKTPDSKISEIVNNINLDKNDKVKLINQLLVRKNINWPTSDELSNNLVDQTFDQSFNDGFQNDDQVSFEKSFDNNTVTSKNSKSSIKKNPKKTTISKALKKRKQNISQLNSFINDLNQTKNNAQLYLPPTASTRNETKKIKNPINFSSEEFQKSIKDFTLSKPLLLNSIDSIAQSLNSNKESIAKSLNPPRKSRLNKNAPYQLPNQDITKIDEKKLKKSKPKANIEQESIEIDQTGEGFWSFYKR